MIFTLFHVSVYGTLERLNCLTNN